MKSTLELLAFLAYIAWAFARAAIETIILGRTAEDQMNGGYDK